MTIAENLDRIETAKEAIKDAIVSKGGQVAEDARIDEYPAAIEALPSGGEEYRYKIVLRNRNVIYSNNDKVIINANAYFYDLQYSFDDVNYISLSTNGNYYCSTTDKNILFGDNEYIYIRFNDFYRNTNPCIYITPYNSEQVFASVYIKNVYKIPSYMFYNIQFISYDLIKIDGELLNMSSVFRNQDYNSYNTTINKIEWNFNDCYMYQTFRFNKGLKELPDIIATKGNYNEAFYFCTNLLKTGEISLMGNLSSYTSKMFYYCTSLKEMTWTATTPPTIASDMLSGCPEDMIIYVPDASVDKYKAASIWSSRAAYIKGISEKPTE